MRQLAAAALIASLAACGQTGPLYLPGQEAPPATAAQPDAAEPAAAESTAGNPAGTSEAP